MSKLKKVYVCQKCGSQKSRWEGKCHDCGSWNSFIEETFSPPPAFHLPIDDFLETHKKNTNPSLISSSPLKSNRLQLHPHSIQKEWNSKRYKTGFLELDRVLGGGMVPGSYILLGGDPGIGKSTLLLQISGFLAQNSNQKILYVSGEESVSQVALRAQRLTIHHPLIEVAAESSLEAIIKIIKATSPKVLIIDSIQTLFLSKISSAPGSILQVRECAGTLMNLAKRLQITVFLIGHVTKDGHLAGPKVLEHMVDTVLSFEGDPNYTYRLLRSLKNRFGPAFELGVFQMDSNGLKDVQNPSEFFLEERNPYSIGSAVFATMEGSRPMLCEIQALNTANHNPMAIPKRTTTGFDIHRLHMINAILDKQLKLNLSLSDVFINIVGGLKVKEPPADLAAASALISSAKNLKINSSTCFFGEIGLTGELRGVSFIIERLREAQKLGFKKFVLPFSNKKHLSSKIIKDLNLKESQFFWIQHIKELPQCFKKLDLV